MERQIDFISIYPVPKLMLRQSCNAELYWKLFLLGGILKAVGINSTPSLTPAKNLIYLKI